MTSPPLPQTAAPARRLPALREAGWVVPLAMMAAGVAVYFAFPDDLAFLTRVLAMALLVLSLDLVVGYCGVATLGHAALFGAGAYAAGIACVNGLTEPVLLLAVGALAGAAMGALSGAVIVRFSGLPQLVLSIAVVQLLNAAANKASWLTGGSDGLSGVAPDPVLGVFAFDLWGRTAFLFSLATLVVVHVALSRIVRSPFGLLCQGIRQDRVRVRALGAAIYPALVKMYAVSGAVAGIGGALLAVTTGVVGLDSVSFERSAEALVMLVLGGAGTLHGALLGALVFQVFEHVVSAADPFHWMTLVGLLLIAVVLFVPRGLQGLGAALRGRLGRRDTAP